MPRVKLEVDIDIDDLFRSTTRKEDEEIIKDILERAYDEQLIEEAIGKRKLFKEVLDEIDEDDIIDYIRERGYVVST